jgi:iron complex outermembrane receptor protein
MGPAHQLQMFWRWNLADTLEWDSGYSFAGRFDGVRAYHGVESRLGWRPSPHWEFSIAGRNLLDNQRAETSTTLDIPNEVGRSVYGKLTWRFGER